MLRAENQWKHSAVWILYALNRAIAYTARCLCVSRCKFKI